MQVIQPHSKSTESGTQSPASCVGSAHQVIQMLAGWRTKMKSKSGKSGQILPLLGLQEPEPVFPLWPNLFQLPLPILVLFSSALSSRPLAHTHAHAHAAR